MPPTAVRVRFGQVFQRQLAILWPLCYMLGILGLSSVPGVIPDDGSGALQVIAWVPPALQNLLHIPVYAGLAFLWCWSLAGRLRRPWALVLPLCLAAGFGILDEYYQFFTPGRYASLTDVLFNAFGAGLGVWLFCLLRRRFRG